VFTQRFLLLLLVGLAAAGALTWTAFYVQRGAHLELTGTLTRVEVLPGDDANSTLVVEYKVTNPSDVPFVTRRVDVTVQLAGGRTVEGTTASESDIRRLLDFYSHLKGITAAALKPRDTVAPRQTVERTVAAGVPASEKDIRARQGLTVRFVDVDGAASEVKESR
jgi:hypothetical protein